MKSPKVPIFEEKPIIPPRFTQPDLHIPLFPDDKGEKLYPKKIQETPKTIYHTTLPKIPFFDH
jgi:hypothetical protein